MFFKRRKKEKEVKIRYKFYDDDLIEIIYFYDKVGVFPVFNIDISACRNPFGYSYSSSDYYFLKQLAQFDSNGSVGSYDSFLRSYYEEYQPSTVGEAFDFGSLRGSYLNRKLSAGFLLPWQSTSSVTQSAGGWQYSGPVSMEVLFDHLTRLESVYTSISRHGYNPGKAASFDSHIKGYLLKSGSSFRFMVTNGTHRMAVLSYLSGGLGCCPVTFRVNNPIVIDVANSNDWPQVRYGNISNLDAMEIFQMIFEGRFYSK